MDVVQQILAAVTVIGVLLGVVWLGQRRGLVRLMGRPSSARGQRLELIDRLALSPQHSLHLVKVDNRVFLVGLAPGSCCLLDSPDLAATLSPESRHGKEGHTR
ncbi:MAG: FliO/MopB family protein [Bryobacterales bacterium]|nr:FliO/MopB family protein [Bryobacterales bacterium]